MVCGRLGGITMKITKEDLEGLRNTIQLIVYGIEERKLGEAQWSLNKLLSNINRTLEGDKLNG